MKRILSAGALLFLAGGALFAQYGKAPQIEFKVVENFFKLPENYLMTEAVGVGVNSQGHIFTANRGNHPLIEFDKDGQFVRSFGEGSTIFHAPHSVRFDAQDN